MTHGLVWKQRYASITIRQVRFILAARVVALALARRLSKHVQAANPVQICSTLRQPVHHLTGPVRICQNKNHQTAKRKLTSLGLSALGLLGWQAWARVQVVMLATTEALFELLCPDVTVGSTLKTQSISHSARQSVSQSGSCPSLDDSELLNY